MRTFVASLAFLALSVSMIGQNTVTFEDVDYKSIGIYDGWEDSPFRKGVLKGNCAVVCNHLADSVNASEKVLALQRSRFGSNTFGVRIDLKEPYELPTTGKEITFDIHRPYGGRVMIIGLGKRADRPHQSIETEQFTLVSQTDIPADSWQHVAIPAKGAPGVLIYSIVVVPDCESPHEYQVDKACYIDNITFELPQQTLYPAQKK